MKHRTVVAAIASVALTMAAIVTSGCNSETEARGSSSPFESSVRQSKANSATTGYDDYIIVTYDIKGRGWEQRMAKKVNSFLGKGYVPVGGIEITHTSGGFVMFAYQAMAKPKR